MSEQEQAPDNPLVYIQRDNNWEGESGVITWCWHRIEDDDVLYVRADLALNMTPELRSQIKESQ